MTLETILLGNDNGFGNTRLFGAQGPVALQSLVATNGTQSISLWATGGLKRAGQGRDKPLLIKTDTEFYVGAGAHALGRPVENLQLERMVGPESKALLYGTLSLYFASKPKPRAPVKIVTALPIALAQGEQGDGLRDQLRAMLVGKHAWSTDPGSDERGERDYKMTIDDVVLTSQPAGAMFDYLLNADGSISPEKKALRKSGAFGVMSIGFNTVELMVVADGQMLAKHVAGDSSGARRVFQLLNQDGAYSLGELDSRYRAGLLDISDVLPIWSGEVFGLVDKYWDKMILRRMSTVFVVGGGAKMLAGPLLKKFQSKLVIPDDPIMSIARGCYRLALTLPK
ncbi:MAG: ParM/StbA family protein [Xanthomonadales bacterium]|nr:ParM/StbA family protein [Xanthomonadales bacterium]